MMMMVDCSIIISVIIIKKYKNNFKFYLLFIIII